MQEDEWKPLETLRKACSAAPLTSILGGYTELTQAKQMILERKTSPILLRDTEGLSGKPPLRLVRVVLGLITPLTLRARRLSLLALPKMCRSTQACNCRVLRSFASGHHLIDYATFQPCPGAVTKPRFRPTFARHHPAACLATTCLMTFVSRFHKPHVLMARDSSTNTADQSCNGSRLFHSASNIPCLNHHGQAVLCAHHLTYLEQVVRVRAQQEDWMKRIETS